VELGQNSAAIFGLREDLQLAMLVDLYVASSDYSLRSNMHRTFLLVTGVATALAMTCLSSVARPVSLGPTPFLKGVTKRCVFRELRAGVLKASDDVLVGFAGVWKEAFEVGVDRGCCGRAVLNPKWVEVDGAVLRLIGVVGVVVLFCARKGDLNGLGLCLSSAFATSGDVKVEEADANPELEVGALLTAGGHGVETELKAFPSERKGPRCAESAGVSMLDAVLNAFSPDVSGVSGASSPQISFIFC
jgi:hypothetical protein